MRLTSQTTRVIQMMMMIVLSNLHAHKMYFPYLKMTKRNLAYRICDRSIYIHVCIYKIWLN